MIPNDLAACEDLVAHQDRGAECQIVHPVTGEPLDITLIVAGPDSGTQRRARLETTDALMAFAGRPPADEQERLAIEQLAKCVIGWLVKQDGQEVPFSFTAVVRMLTKFAFIREQVDAFAASRAPYMPRVDVDG